MGTYRLGRREVYFLFRIRSPSRSILPHSVKNCRDAHGLGFAAFNNSNLTAFKAFGIRFFYVYNL